MKNIISESPYYKMFFFGNSDFDNTILKTNSVGTLFVDDGEISLKINQNKTTVLYQQEGLVFSGDTNIKIEKNDGNFFLVLSELNGKDVIEIIDKGGKRNEVKLQGYRIIKKPKKVNKPWGHEIWISWFKNHHVLKKIYMEAGNKCSLQYHEFKYETNYILRGKARVLKDIEVKKGLSEIDALNDYNNIKNIKNYLVEMNKGDYWSNRPYEIHRVFSIESYTAYEASTPELDDVIRLQDDSNRISGTIISEHIE